MAGTPSLLPDKDASFCWEFWSINVVVELEEIDDEERVSGRATKKATSALDGPGCPEVVVRGQQGSLLWREALPLHRQRRAAAASASFAC